MIKLKHLLNEVLENNSIQNVVDKVYPQIVNDLGGQIKPVEIHTNIWDRLGAVGVEDLKREQGNPDAQYDPYDNIIYLYSEKTNTEEEIIKSLLHEHTAINQYLQWHDSKGVRLASFDRNTSKCLMMKKWLTFHSLY